MTLLKDLTEDTTPELTDVLYGVKDPDGTPLDRRMSIENVLKLGASVNLVDRGDPSAVDFDVGDFTADNTWRDLDLSSIVPAGATMVRLYCRFNPGTNSARTVHFRKNGNTNAVNVTGYYTINEWIFEYREMDVFCDSNRVIEYRVSGSMNTMDVTVVGWLTDTSSMVALGYSDKLVDRGDVAAWDWEVGDFTTDDTWRDLDCSDIVPTGATYIYIKIELTDDLAGKYFGFRKNGTTGAANSQYVFTQVSNVVTSAFLMIPCDANRVIEYRGENITFVKASVVILGWIEGSSDYPAMNLVARESAPDYDFELADLTMDNTFYDLDLSSIVPAGATWVQLRLKYEDDNSETHFTLRKNGETGAQNHYVTRTQASGVTNDTTMLIPCDTNRIIEYRGENTTWNSFYIVILGWVIDNSTYAPLKDLVSRGAASANWDWDEDDLTTDNTWNELDISSVVPAGATWALIKATVWDDVIDSELVFRPNHGAGNAYASFITHEAFTIEHGQFLIPLDSNRIIEYKGSNVTFAGIYILILGWIMGSTSEALPYAPNDIINPEFAIAQEGATITAASTPANSDDTYVLDQWILLSDGNDVADITRESTAPPTGSKYNIKVEIETASKKVGIFQPIENQNSLKYTGDHASLSFWLKGDVDNIRAAIVSWDSTADTITSDIVSAWAAEGTNPTLATNWTYENTPANIAPTGSWIKHEIEGILIDTSGMTNLGVFFWLDDTDAAVDEYFEIGKVKLEQNLVCTKFMPLPIGKEIERCKRFFQKSYPLETAPGSGSTAYCLCYQGQPISNAEYMHNGITYPVAMRVAPTVTLYSEDGTSGNIEVAGTNRAASVVWTTENGVGGIRNDSGVLWDDGTDQIRFNYASTSRL